MSLLAVRGITTTPPDTNSLEIIVPIIGTRKVGYITALMNTLCIDIDKLNLGWIKGDILIAYNRDINGKRL